jgi:hypothetical protein
MKNQENIKYYIYPEYSVYNRQNEQVDDSRMDRKYCMLNYKKVEFIEKKPSGFYDQKVYVVKSNNTYFETPSELVFDVEENAKDYVHKHNKDLFRNMTDRLIVVERKLEKILSAFK